MILLKHGAQIDHAVDVGASRRVSPDRRFRGLREKIAQATNSRVRRCGILGGRKRVDAEAAVGLGGMTEMHRLCIRQPDHRGGMEALADDEALREVLVRATAGKDRRGVMRRGAGGVAAVANEIVLRPGGISAAGLGGRGENPGPFAVEIDQLLGDRLALGRIGMQQTRLTLLAQHRGELPAEIESVLHRDVHTLPRLGAMGVAGIASDEDARQARCDLRFRHVIELVGQALADLVDRPPGDFLHVKRMRLQDPLRFRNHVFGGDVAAGDALADLELGETRHRCGPCSRLPWG